MTHTRIYRRPFKKPRDTTNHTRHCCARSHIYNASRRAEINAIYTDRIIDAAPATAFFKGSEDIESD